jgi:hypothetical protein
MRPLLSLTALASLLCAAYGGDDERAAPTHGEQAHVQFTLDRHGHPLGEHPAAGKPTC